MTTEVTRKTVLVFASVLAGLSAAGAQDAAQARARRAAQRLMQQESLPALSVAVSQDGELIWSEAYGFADLEHQVPATTRTRFRVASISKAITSAAVGQLFETGELDLDASIRDYVPEYPDKGHRITTRQLAGHLSGIPHYKNEDIVNTVRYRDVIHALDKFKDRPLEFDPGARFGYSSFGWNLIAAVVERASGTPFLTYMQELVFEPAEMNDTIADHYDEIIPNRTGFYFVRDGKAFNAPAVDNSDVWAGGGFLSTPSDLTRFANAMLDGVLVSEETWELLTTPLTDAEGNSTGYGLGWSHRRNGNQLVVGHSGGHVGASSDLVIFPDEGLVVAATTNASSQGLSSLTRELASYFR